MEDIRGGDLEEVEEARGRRYSAFEIFPEELWLMVFDDVPEPEDLKSCVKVSNEFGQMLETKRARYLFPEVIPVLIANVFPFLDKSDLLSMRLVCHAWKLGIDNCVTSSCQEAYLKTTDNSINKNMNLPLPLLNEMTRPYRFQNLTQVKTFLIMGHRGHHSLPFKYLEFHDNIDSREVFPRAVCRLLETVGHSLEHLSISNIFKYDFLSSFSRFVARTPNLKILRLNKLRMSSLHFNSDENTRLPALPLLETLSISSSDQQVVHKFLHIYGGSVKSLELFGCLIPSEIPRREEVEIPHLPQLTRLSLTEDDFFLIDSPQVETWPVEQVTVLSSIGIHVNKVDCYPAGQPLFDTVNRLKATLKTLDISSCYRPLFLYHTHLIQQLAHLEHLKATVITDADGIQDQRYQSFNFLRNMPSLKYLHLRVKKINRGAYQMETVNRERELVDNIGFTGSNDIYQSNVWKVLPNLKRITVKKETTTCARCCSDRHVVSVCRCPNEMYRRRPQVTPSISKEVNDCMLPPLRKYSIL